LFLKHIIIFVYIISGIAAGIVGSIQASQLNTGRLIGVFVISVIQNGMNLFGMESYIQQVVLGQVKEQW
jgi:ribose/xylose/arabinose/galactoside ABC-type transport system permease subunit